MKRFVYFLLFFFLSSCFSSFNLYAQAEEKQEKLPFFQAAEEFNKTRFWTMTGIGATVYTGSMIGLNELWYAGYERSAFHFFDDRGEWNDMDKVGHCYSAYNESLVFYKGSRWIGMNKKQAIWTGVGIGTLMQASIEILDGFSEKWGFSVADIGMNTLGVGIFAAQQFAWDEQRIVMKFSSFRKPYPNTTITSTDGTQSTTLPTHTDDLFGATYVQYFLKDYNAQTIWLSVNPYSFMNNKNSKFPKWLNIAVGYGVQNIFGGFGNTWTSEDATYVLSAADYPRYRQFYLSLDVDLTKIKTKSHFLKTLLTLANMLKIPAPAIEFNTLGKMRFHSFYF